MTETIKWGRNVVIKDSRSLHPLNFTICLNYNYKYIYIYIYEFKSFKVNYVNIKNGKCDITIIN